MALILTVRNPGVCIKDAVCAIICSVENTYISPYSVKVALFEGSSMLDVEPDLHYHDIPAGETYEFKGFWDTLKFTPDTVKTYNLKVKLTVSTGTITTQSFSIQCEEKPDFFDSLLASIGVGNNEQITKPVEALFEYEAIPGFTTPPFTCPLCNQVFGKENGTEEEDAEATQAFIGHLAKGINDTISALHVRNKE